MNKILVQVHLVSTDKAGTIGLINSGTQIIILNNPPYQDNINKGLDGDTIKP